MADGNDQAKVSQNVEQYAEQAKKDLNGDGGGGWFGGLFDAIHDMGAKADAMTAAAAAGQFAASPDLAAAMTKKFTEMQDIIGGMQNKASAIAQNTPLGGGYGEKIGQMNGEVGRSASDLMVEFDRKLQALRQAVQDSVARYRQNDDDAAGNLKKM